MSHDAYTTEPVHPIFRDTTIGFRVTTEDGTAFVPFRVVRPFGSPPPDWQGGGRILRQDQVPGSGRVLIEDLGAEPQTFSTRLVFQDAHDLDQFMAMLPYAGTLILDADWTREPADRYVHQFGKTYAEFDNVRITGMPSSRTFDMRKAPFIDVTFQREAPTRTLEVR